MIAAPAPQESTAVTPEPTTQELRTESLTAWLGSIVLHGLVLLGFLTLFRPSPMTVPTEPFHWDVMLVHSPETADEPGQAVDATEPTIASSATSQKEPAASISDKPAPHQPQASDPPLQQTDTPVNAPTADPSTSQTASATSSDGTVGSMEPDQPSLSPALALDRESASTPRLDYGWLQQAIFKRLEELKRSSRPFLDQSQPLKVMVKAVVSREGSLLDSWVAKSSGLDHIDQEAMALVQRAFPMQLDRTLDRQQIVMRIPITYSRE